MSGSAQPTAQLLPPRVPPKPPEPWAERAEVGIIREMLLAGELATLTSAGRGGLGKTALAAKLAWDPALRAHFTDGILWVSLGKTPDVLGELARLAARFGEDVSSYADVATRKEVVCALLVNKQCLLIVDDAWTAEAARVFFELAPGPVLLTTRVSSIADEIAPESLMALGQLLPEQAVSLLKRLAPGAAAAPELPRLAALADGLPLMLSVLGPIIARAARLGLGLAKVIAEIESPVWRGNALNGAVAASLDDLTEADRLAFAQLAVFGARPADFDALAIAAVWEAAEGAAASRLDIFVDRNLIDADGKGRFSLHQSIADAAQARLPADDPAPARHAAYYLALVNRDREDWRTIAAELPQIRRAGETLARDAAQLLEFIWAMRRFWERQGLGAEHLQWNERGLKAAQALEQQEDKATLLNNIGAVYADLGGGQRALEYFEQALPLCEAVGDRAGQAVTLTNIGRVYDRLGEGQRALAYLEQALPLQEAVGDRRGQATTLTNIGHVYAGLGEGQRALEYYAQALPLCEAVGDRAGQAVTLFNMASISYKEGNLAETERLLTQVVALAEAVEDPNLERHRKDLLYIRAMLAEQAKGNPG